MKEILARAITRSVECLVVGTGQSRVAIGASCMAFSFKGMMHFTFRRPIPPESTNNRNAEDCDADNGSGEK